MIELTRLNGTQFSLNAIYIERLDSTPDTVVTLLSGKKVHVLEAVNEVADKITAYYQLINILPTTQRQTEDR